MEIRRSGSRPSETAPLDYFTEQCASIRCSRHQIRRVLVAPASHSNPTPGPHGTHIPRSDIDRHVSLPI